MRTPHSYTLTALASLAVVERVLAGDAPVGYQTPAKAYGADFVLDIEGVTRDGRAAADLITPKPMLAGRHERSMIYNPQLEGDPFLWEGGPTGVLLIHGYTATTAEVRPLARILHQQGYTVAGPLLPGHHTRPADANRYRWRDWVRAVEESYQQLTAHCQRVIIGGESMGALLALYLASEHPEAAAILAFAPRSS